MKKFFEKAEIKAMPNTGQLDFLNSMLGLDGDYADSILKENEIYYAVKIACLEKAITERDEYKFKDFLKPLHDLKLNNGFLDTVQLINTLFYNREINYIYGEHYPTTVKKPILVHYFASLGKGEINLIAFQNAIKELTQNFILKLDKPYCQENALYWKDKIKNEFMIEKGDFNEIEVTYLGNTRDESAFTKFWKDIYKQLNKESFDISGFQIYKSQLSPWFIENFNPDFLLYPIKRVCVNGIQTRGGCLTNYASFQNKQNLLNFFFKQLSSAPFSMSRSLCPDIFADIANSKLRQAVVFHQVDEVLILLQSGIDINQKSIYSHRSPLFLACQFGHLDLVEILLSNGADVNQKNEASYITALDFAINEDNQELATLLIKFGAEKQNKMIAMETFDEKSWLEEHLALGKKQGFLTYAQINTFIPNLTSPHFEVLKTMFEGLNILVFEELTPEAERLLVLELSFDESNCMDEASFFAELDGLQQPLNYPTRWYI